MQTDQNIGIPGITIKGSEFFVDENGELQLAHKIRISSFDNAPAFLVEKMASKMPFPTTDKSVIKAFIAENYGVLDGEPDIDEDGNVSDPECGPNQKQPQFDNGNEISPAQLLVLQNFTLSPQGIADKLFRSKKTIDRHIEDMLKEGQFINAKALGIWAAKKRII